MPEVSVAYRSDQVAERCTFSPGRNPLPLPARGSFCPGPASTPTTCGNSRSPGRRATVSVRTSQVPDGIPAEVAGAARTRSCADHHPAGVRRLLPDHVGDRPVLRRPGHPVPGARARRPTRLVCYCLRHHRHRPGAAWTCCSSAFSRVDAPSRRTSTWTSNTSAARKSSSTSTRSTAGSTRGHGGQLHPLPRPLGQSATWARPSKLPEVEVDAARQSHQRTDESHGPSCGSAHAGFDPESPRCTSTCCDLTAGDPGLPAPPVDSPRRVLSWARAGARRWCPSRTPPWRTAR